VCRNALQAAICAEACNQAAEPYLRAAMQIHAMVFRVGAAVFLRRFEHDLQADLAQIWVGGASPLVSSAAWGKLQMAKDKVATAVVTIGDIQPDSWENVSKSIASW